MIATCETSRLRPVHPIMPWQGLKNCAPMKIGSPPTLIPEVSNLPTSNFRVLLENDSYHPPNVSNLYPLQLTWWGWGLPFCSYKSGTQQKPKKGPLQNH